MLTIVRRLFGIDPEERSRQEERDRNERRAHAARLIREVTASRLDPPLRLAPVRVRR
ncbi:hypothetical protein [Enterovirga rhinocerotis]|uniref:Uncharacterized protein n=1 Tax=Enterovirga rhinocerotis TaxID=1339210 RepID=A0A4R7BWS9_9HYPH|nr:hypothetical protein [Enterovirga rhinocerotis]TDR90360.1 hypothetical protein EV668_3211 [Enterovirga rhinocerotis]